MGLMSAEDRHARFADGGDPVVQSLVGGMGRGGGYAADQPVLGGLRNHKAHSMEESTLRCSCKARKPSARAA